ncbi:hypothetical protein [Bordetella sp. N]|uniref:hypothetical protein n=1 Tax=Bordetella sp. N TaxID=1746199 RepID=UPI000708F3BC|nr:hypothetical protein [Bordetella sp. N]ALM86563.1 virulence factor [Bordetella sp. N]
MKKHWLVAGLGAAALMISSAAMARVDVGIAIGVPPLVVAPAPVYVAPPPPVYVAPAPVYYGPPAPVVVAPRPYYYPGPVIYGGWHGGYRGGPPPRYYRGGHGGYGHGPGWHR